MFLIEKLPKDTSEVVDEPLGNMQCGLFIAERRLSFSLLAIRQ